MTRLSVNVNKIALLRNSRGTDSPSVTGAAQCAVDNGAHGITVHPRPDARHIRYSDVRDLKEMLEVELNIEGNPTPDFLDLVCEVLPGQCTLVPDDPGQLTSDHGWDLEKNGEELVPIVQRLKSAGIRVSLFMDPEPSGMKPARDIGADRVELYTESYAAAFAKGDYKNALDTFIDSAKAAAAEGLGINAGHDLDIRNLGPFINAIPAVEEVSIGHALIGEALYDGLAPTVRAYVEVLRQASGT